MITNLKVCRRPFGCVCKKILYVQRGSAHESICHDITYTDDFILDTLGGALYLDALLCLLSFATYASREAGNGGFAHTFRSFSCVCLAISAASIISISR